MKALFKISFFSMLALFMFACGEDDPDKIPFSELTVEENKQVVENSAIEVAKTMDQMKDVEAVGASVSFGMHLDMDDPMDHMYKKAKFYNTIAAVAGLQDESTNIYDVMKAVADPGEFDEDPETIQELWDDLTGVYVWNSATEEWDYTDNSEKIEFKFPSTEDGATNNATLLITNYTGYTGPNPIDEEYEGDLPASLDIEFTVDGEVIMTFTFAVEYNEDGIPTSLAADMTMDVFKMEVDMTNNDKKAEASYKFTNNGEIVLEMSGNIEGDFSDENIEENTITYTDTYELTDYVWNDQTYTYDEVVVTETDEWEELNVGGVFYNGGFKFQVYSIAINGKGNIQNLADSLEIIYPDNRWDDPNWDEEAAAEAEAELINNNLDIWVVDEDSNTKIAEAEAYVVKDSWGNDYTDYWVDMRLKFGDGSLIDLETYFEDGFEDFVREINGMIGELNGEYDLDMDPIDY